MVELSTLGGVIKTAYEAQANTNAFTDAEKQKLDSMGPAGPVQFSDVQNVPNFVPQSQRGVANGHAPLDAANLVPLIHLNVGGLSFKGAWDPRTNTPALVDGTGSVGDFYKASAAGSFNFGNGNFNFVVGDWAIYAGGTWQRIGVTDAVAMVNGKIGSVILTAADVGAVATVNGKSGPAVTLTASDFGAIASVNGKSGQSVTLTASDVGALPSNYTPPAATWSAVTGKPDFAAQYQAKQRGPIGPAIPAALVYKTVNQAIASGTEATVTWNTAAYDSFSMLQSGDRLVVPAWAKYVRLSSAVQWGGASGSNTNPARSTPQINGAFVPGLTSARQFGNLNVMTTEFHTAIVPVVGGDVITLVVAQSTAATRNVEGVTGRTWMQVELYE